MGRATLDAIATAALEATGARGAWIVVAAGSELEVVAIAGAGTGAVGSRVGRDATIEGFVLAANQPLSLSGDGDDLWLPDDGGVLGTRYSRLVAVPCVNEHDTVGVLAVAGMVDGQTFTVDDVEIVTLLGGIAGAALSDVEFRSEPPDPEVMYEQLLRIAAADPRRYRTLAAAVAGLLSG